MTLDCQEAFRNETHYQRFRLQHPKLLQSIKPYTMSTPPSDLPRSTPSSLPSHRQSSSSTQPFIALTKPEKAQLLRIIKVHLKVFLASLGLLQALEVGKAGLRSARSKGPAR